MDPLTHALLGATAAHAIVGPRTDRRIWLIGAIGGMLPDADILISSASDPLLAIEYHRHFTHSFAFIPLGGLIAALPWLVQKRYRPDSRAILAAATLGYATHGLLDACTNYGTHLLWPFSTTMRTAWHWITTIGPLLTLILLVGLIIATRYRSRLPAIIALTLSLAYIGIAALQRERALHTQQPIAASRTHPITRADMFPTVGNPFIWRSVYQSGNTLYTDRIRLWGNTSQWKAGSAVALLREQDLPPDAQADPRVRRDFARFNYFSDGWVGRATGDASVIGDARYSLRTDAFEPIWGVRFHPGTAAPTEWVDRTAQNRIPMRVLWEEITGKASGYQAIVKRK